MSLVLPTAMAAESSRSPLGFRGDGAGVFPAKGLLAMDADPEGDIRDRHIAHMGMDEINWGPSGPTAYGNRIFIRSNDHLYCIGKGAYRPPR